MSMVTRRTALSGLAGAASTVLMKPALAQRNGAALRFVPQSDLVALDPIWTTGYVVRNHGYMVFDTLYAMDSTFRVHPQMAAGHDVTDEGRSVTITLREGLRFHDGAPVLARDCVASIRRWAARDGFGQTLMAETEELAALDDQRLRFRLRRPFPLLTQALGKLSSPVPFMMPERLASTDPNQQIREAVGSGPFRFLADEWRQGVGAAYARFDGYVPRAEKPDGMAGGKHVEVPRVEWRTIPDTSTAMSAFRAGEVDWLETTNPDLLPLIATRRDVTVSTLDEIGTYMLMRFNCLLPPFNDAAVRRAVLRAVKQEDYLAAMAGAPEFYRECKAFFPCGTPLSTGAGAEIMDGRLEAAQAMLKASAYDGRKVVIIASADQPLLAPVGEVTADLLRKLGMQVELVTTDWGSLLARRASQKPVEEGGWNIFHTFAVGPEFMSPASHLALRGTGRAGWAGWFSDPDMEALRTDWFSAPDETGERTIAAAMERRAFEQAPYVPLGQVKQPMIYRDNVHGILSASAPLFWNVRVS